MPRPNPGQHFVGGDAAARHVLPNRIREEAVKACTLGWVELVDVVCRDELNLRSLGEGARFIEHESVPPSRGRPVRSTSSKSSTT